MDGIPDNGNAKQSDFIRRKETKVTGIHLPGEYNKSEEAGSPEQDRVPGLAEMLKAAETLAGTDAQSRKNGMIHPRHDL